MNRPAPTRSRRESGSSIVELTIGGALIAILGVAAMSLTAASRDGAATARVATMRTTSLRNASTVIREDLVQSAVARLTVTKVAGQNDVVTLQRPILTAGAAPVWGAFDPKAAPALRMRADHFTRFVVVGALGGRELRRQTLAPDLTMIAEEVVARGLAGGAAVLPGLTVDQVGDMWRVTIGLEQRPNKPPESIQFDVAPKN
jgi:hypothetical protein